MIEIKEKKGKKDKEAKILTIALILLSQYYDVEVNGEKWENIIK